MTAYGYLVASILVTLSGPQPSVPDAALRGAVEAVLARPEVTLRVTDKTLVNIDIASLHRHSPGTSEQSWNDMIVAFGAKARARKLEEVLTCRPVVNPAPGSKDPKVCSMPKDDLVVHVINAEGADGRAVVRVEVVFAEGRGRAYPEGGTGSISFSVRMASVAGSWKAESIAIYELS